MLPHLPEQHTQNNLYILVSNLLPLEIRWREKVKKKKKDEKKKNLRTGDHELTLELREEE
jgi:hypothetical protein